MQRFMYVNNFLRTKNENWVDVRNKIPKSIEDVLTE